MKKQVVAVTLAALVSYSSAASADLIGTLLINAAAIIFMDNTRDDSKASAESRKQKADDGTESRKLESADKSRLPDSSADKAD